MRFWEWFARIFICDGCGWVEKCFHPQDKFNLILEDWSTKPKRRFIFCKLDCLRKWLEK